MKTEIVGLTMLLRDKKFSKIEDLQNLRKELENLSSKIADDEKSKNDLDSGNVKNEESFNELVTLLINFFKSKKNNRTFDKKTILTDVFDILTVNF